MLRKLLPRKEVQSGLQSGIVSLCFFFYRGRGTFGCPSGTSGLQPHISSWLLGGSRREIGEGGLAGRPPAGARRAGPQALVNLAGEEPGEVSN